MPGGSGERDECRWIGDARRGQWDQCVIVGVIVCGGVIGGGGGEGLWVLVR